MVNGVDVARAATALKAAAERKGPAYPVTVTYRERHRGYELKFLVNCRVLRGAGRIAGASVLPLTPAPDLAGQMIGNMLVASGQLVDLQLRSGAFGTWLQDRLQAWRKGDGPGEAELPGHGERFEGLHSPVDAIVCAVVVAQEQWRQLQAAHRAEGHDV